MIDSRIQNNNHSVLDVLKSIAKLYNDKGKYDLQNEQEIIDLIRILIDKMNSAFKYRVFKLTIGRPNRLWDL